MPEYQKKYPVFHLPLQDSHSTMFHFFDPNLHKHHSFFDLKHILALPETFSDHFLSKHKFDEKAHRHYWYKGLLLESFGKQMSFR